MGIESTYLEGVHKIMMIEQANFPVVIEYFGDIIRGVVLYDNMTGNVFSIDAGKLSELLLREIITVRYLKVLANGRLVETAERKSPQYGDGILPIRYKTPMYIVNSSRWALQVMYFSLKENRLKVEEVPLSDARNAFMKNNEQLFMNATISNDKVIIRRMDGGIREIPFSRLNDQVVRVNPFEYGKREFNRAEYAERVKREELKKKEENSQRGRLYSNYGLKTPVAVHRVPENVVGIQKFTGGCNTLEIHANLTLGKGCFEDALDVWKVIFLAGTTKVDPFAFYNSQVQDASFSSEMDKIGTGAFANSCLRGNVITNASYISSSAFEGTDIVTAKLFKVKYIGKSAFSECEKLKKLVLGDFLEVIEPQAFWYCTSLRDVMIPPTTKVIGRGAFAYSPMIKAMVPKHTIIEEGAFHPKATVLRYE